MKKVFLLIMFVCVNVLAWGQTEKGKELLEKAKAGDASAQSELAECYEFGEEGFGKDEKQAVAWYTKAAEQNDRFALGKLTSAYQSGKLGVAKNDEKYIHYLKKHAESGVPESMIDLAICYRDGKYGLKKDENEFLRWAQEAAKGTSSKAKYELGAYYKSKNNKDEAIKWYKDCADYYYKLFGKNHEDAIRDLKQLGVNYDPANKTEDVKKTDAKKNDADDCAVKDGKVILYDRSGEVLQSAAIMEKNGVTHVKVDNGLYKLKPCNVKVNGVSYNYSVFLFDRDYYVKGNIPGFKSGAGSSKSGSSASAKSSSSSQAKKQTASPAKKETASPKKEETPKQSEESSISKEIKKVEKTVKDIKKFIKK